MKSNYFQNKQMRRNFYALLAVALGVAGFALILRAKEFDMPPDTEALKPGPGIESAAMCTACHSPDYLWTQPPMPRAFWKAEVTKMIEKYGAPIKTNQVDAIADYLVATYGKKDATKTAAK